MGRHSELSAILFGTRISVSGSGISSAFRIIKDLSSSDKWRSCPSSTLPSSSISFASITYFHKYKGLRGVGIAWSFSPPRTYTKSSEIIVFTISLAPMESSSHSTEKFVLIAPKSRSYNERYSAKSEYLFITCSIGISCSLSRYGSKACRFS